MTAPSSIPRPLDWWAETLGPGYSLALLRREARAGRLATLKIGRARAEHWRKVDEDNALETRIPDQPF